MDTYAELLALAEDLAARAADLLLERIDTPRSDVRTKSSATDMVSEVDRAAEALIVEGVRAQRPDDGILSEEGAEATTRSAFRWVVDPLDGTTNYLYGHPGYAVSIGIEQNGESVVGVVHDPAHGEVFTAVRGRGAFRNGVAIAPSGETTLEHTLVATGFGYEAAGRRAQAAAVERVIGSIRDIRRMGAAAVDLCSVACGRVDGYYERGLNAWDLCAGSLVAAEAGATVGSIEGGPVEPGSVIAASPAVFEPLRRLLIDAGA